MNDKKLSGMEMMLRSLGMGEILDLAKSLAEDGTFGKIIEFADKADDILKALERVEHELKLAREQREGMAADYIGGTGAAEIEAGSGPDDCTIGRFAPRLVHDGSGAIGSAGRIDNGRIAGDGAASPSIDDGATGSLSASNGAGT